MDKDCRICLDAFKCLTICKDLFDQQNALLLSQIRLVTGLQVKNIKGQPTHICNICLMDLGCAIEFRKRCLFSQKQLSEEINAVNDFCDAIEFKNEADKDIGESDPLSLASIEEVLEFKHNDVTESAEQPQAIDFDAFDNEEEPTLNLKRNAVKVNKNVGPFVCDECGKSMKDQSNFREHKLRHSGIKNFKCKHCPKCFFTHRELVRHTRRHTGERPYTCKYCPKTAADHSTMTEHERRHINYRPFECSECEKSFVSSSCLAMHRVVHKPSSRTHNCEICDAWFKRIDHLRAHMKSRSHKEKAQAKKPQSTKSKLN